VRACLVSSEWETPTPDLTRFDWDRIKGQEDAAVCAFRVFSSIGSVKGSKQWLESQGFKASIDYISIGRVPATRVYGIWRTKTCGDRYKEQLTWVGAITHMLISGDFWLTVWVTENNEVKSTGAYFNSK